MIIKKKKICIISTVHPAFDIRIFYKQAKSFIKAGYNVTLIVSHNVEEVVEGVKIVPLKYSKNRFERIFFKTFQAFLLAYIENADVYHFHDPELYLTEVAIKIFKRKPIIHDAHEHYEKDILGKKWIKDKYKKVYLFSFKIYEKLCLPFVDVIIYVVPAIGERFNKFKGKTIEIRNYPNSELFFQVDNNIKDFKRAIFVGGVSSIRGITQLIDAFHIVISEIPDAKLDIVGKVSENYKQELVNKIIKLNLENNIMLYDQVPIPELRNYLSKASVGLVTYLPVTDNNVIGLPNKIFEYMSCKLAVIGSNFPLYEEVINDSKCGYTVNPDSPEKIAEKLIYLFNNSIECLKMGESGYNSIISNYNWENESKKLLDLYDQLLEE